MTDTSNGRQMNAMTIDGFGGPDVFKARSVPVPDVGPDDVLVKVQFAGVGVWDAAMRDGKMEAQKPEGVGLPRVLGADGSGTVEAVGTNVTGFAAGDAVYAYGFFNPKGGLYAQYAAVPSTQVAKLPETMDLEQAGILAVPGLTALRGVDDTLGVSDGYKLLIFGASGGVGLPAVQLARILGGSVLAVVSSAEGSDAVRDAGADQVVNSKEQDLASAVDAFAPDGLDGVLALVGAPGLEVATGKVKRGGRVAFPGGVQPEPTAPDGVEVKMYMGAPGREALDRLNALIAKGPFLMHVAGRMPLVDVAKAHEALKGTHVGRLVLTIG